MDKQLLIKKYVEALDEGRPAIFAGAGLSASAGFVSWPGLLADVAKTLNVKIEPHTDLVELAQYYVNETRNKTELSRTILNAFPRATAPTTNHRILASLPIDVYWTTNFDKLIERSLEDAGKRCDVKSQPSRLAISASGCNTTVYKMHGDVDVPDQTILTRDQFEQYPETHKAFLNNFNYDLTNRTFLFLGLSFDDPNLQLVLKYARSLYKDNQRIHYYIVRRVQKNAGESDDAFANRVRMQEYFVDDMKNYGIQTLFIDEFSEITEILQEIKRRYFRKTIFISGAAHSYAPYAEDDFKAFIRKLSEDLIRSGYRIVNGYGLGFGNEVIAGAMQAINDMHLSVDGTLDIRPFPQDISDPATVWPAYRQEMISRTGTTLFFIGNKLDKKTGDTILSNGVRNEYDISKANDSFLIPVGATGSMAEELWNEVIAEISAGGSIYEPYNDYFKVLGEKGAPLDKLHTTIMDLLKAINQ